MRFFYGLFLLFLAMVLQDKYYYINSQLGRLGASLIKWNERFTIDVIENYERVQYIDVYLLKFKDKPNKPKSQSYQKVRPVLKELFEDYYNGSLRFLIKNYLDDWEYYVTEKDKKHIKFEAYSTNESHTKGSISLDLRNDIEDFNLSVFASKELKGRHQARKHGTPITFELFKKPFNLTIQYLSDHESLLIYYEQFSDNFYKIVSGNDKEVELFDVSAEKSFKQIISQLEKRKNNIENRLIENDRDSKDKRLQLRGELEGIKYSLKTIEIHK